ncbi:DUF3108 domain-containing protein [Noviherbaspirillum cavernae]|uniref:DUF3108 domain-containing protein n=1 Tax=Noviherbaspirillum cavernae TaxID=2320862 RepID=A0A418WXJ4_9BURK|nr:DUF3108 domain-containing protein [Noviherbaspirillum cavernae]RJG04944.1 DUF3108 domain-containing protein [Noviherbaspirillum cavernae]
MRDFLVRAVASITLAVGMLSVPAWAQDVPAKKLKINLPPSADLAYAIKARQKGLTLEGNATVRWSASGNRFAVVSETRAMMLGKILETRSEGVIDEYGLAPSSFTQKRFRKAATTSSFDRASKAIRFSASEQTYRITGGEQDRSSVVWQLISMARAMPAKFKPGTQWHFFVVGDRDGDPWTFKVISQEKLETPNGTVNAVHISRAPPDDSSDQKLDIWLAPSMEWYPVRLRFSEEKDDFVEQTLTHINKKASR